MEGSLLQMLIHVLRQDFLHLQGRGKIEITADDGMSNFVRENILAEAGERDHDVFAFGIVKSDWRRVLPGQGEVVCVQVFLSLVQKH